MSKNVDGGQAFPWTTDIGAFKGMTMRDWFAGMAMNAVAMNNLCIEDVVRYAYGFADKMIEVGNNDD